MLHLTHCVNSPNLRINLPYPRYISINGRIYRQSYFIFAYFNLQIGYGDCVFRIAVCIYKRQEFSRKSDIFSERLRIFIQRYW
jgi:uncharacterized membrane protein YhaH (DUF805 family)